MTIIFDFDHTLFDTGRMKVGIRGIFLDGGVSGDRFDETYRILSEGEGYHPARQAHLLAHDWLDEAAKSEALKRVDVMLSNSGECVFEGATEMLKSLRNRGDRLILLTKGDLGWQQVKVNCSGLAASFDQVEITSDSRKASRLKELVGEGEAATVVDDNPGELAAMMEVRPGFRYIYFHRPVNPFSGPGCEEAISMAEVRGLLMGESTMV